MLERLPAGGGYAIPGQQFVIAVGPKSGPKPTSGLRCEWAYHLKQKDDIAGIDYYALEVTACNDGDSTVNELRVSVEISREHMEGGETIVAEVDARDQAMRLFKFPPRDNSHREPPRISLEPEERRFISQLTFTARRKHYLEGTDGRIRVRLLADGRVVASEEKPIVEMLNEERLCFYQSQ